MNKGKNKRKHDEPDSNDKLVKRTLNLSLTDSVGSDKSEISSNEGHRPDTIDKTIIDN